MSRNTSEGSLDDRAQAGVIADNVSSGQALQQRFRRLRAFVRQCHGDVAQDAGHFRAAHGTLRKAIRETLGVKLGKRGEAGG